MLVQSCRILGTLGLLAIVIGCREDAESPNAPAAAPAIAGAAGLAFQDVKAGWDHSCGLTTDARIYCWGRNQEGQLGDGTQTDHPTPVAVGDGLYFSSVSTGTYHTCGVTTDNRLYCWGWNSYGQLGIASGAWNHPAPMEVAGGRRYRAVEAGETHTCAITTGSRAFCWGRNQKGQLGDGTMTNRSSPVAVAGSLLFQQMSAGYWHSCGVTTANRAYCWGANLDGRLGDGTTIQRVRPQAVAGGHLFRHAKAGERHSCGVSTAGRAYCWGDDSSGELGDGASRTGRKLSPIGVVGGLMFRVVDAGLFDTSCGVTTEYKAYCWGNGGFSQIGDGTETSRTWPRAVAGGLQFRWLSPGGLHACGVTNGNRAYCWGYNAYGPIGDGSQDIAPKPVLVAGQM